MKTGDFRLRRSKIICWWLFGLFTVATLISLIVIMMNPYLGGEGLVIPPILAAVFFYFARRPINIKYISLSSVPLCQLGKGNKPEAVGSGCLINYNDKRLLLTAHHVTGDQKNWAIQLEYCQKNGAKCYQLGSMWSVKRFTLDNLDGENIDFSYVEVPKDIPPFRHVIREDGTTISKEPITIYDYNFDTLPNQTETYGFSGMVMSEKRNNLNEGHREVLDSFFSTYFGLNYLREENEYYVFKLPYKHPGRIYFEGCSGAPIVNSRNKIVGLVCKGYDKTDEIYAIALPKLKVIVDAILAESK